MSNHVDTFGTVMGQAMAKYRDVDFIIMDVSFRGAPYLCPKCSHLYNKIGWLRRHLFKTGCGDINVST